jgi:DNA-binding FadR family transcriptional regulator
MDLDRAFHDQIAIISGNRTMIQLLKMFNQLMEQYRRQRRVGFSSKSSAEEEFGGVINAIAEGDEEQARIAMAHHFRLSKAKALVEEINKNTDSVSVTSNKSNGMNG